MSQHISYTTEEIAQLLKISKLTVYDLIKKGEILSYRVGKQMRIDAADLDAYKQRSKAKGAGEQHAMLAQAAPITTERISGAPVLTGQDISLDILSSHLEQRMPGLRPLRSHVGSLEGLISMYRGEADIVSTHLLDGDSGEYNLPYIRRLLIGMPYIVVNLLSRPAGIYVGRGNPHGISNWTELGRPGLRLANREVGSGARVLLDEQLRLNGILPSSVSGYDNIHTSHLSVASKVAAGEADVGVGTARAAAIVEHVDFIPLTQERYDLVILKNDRSKLWLHELLTIIRSEKFVQELQAISGYDLSLTGQVLYESPR
ncbi:helix-turn-helix transcriptional regulator [Paenibacillus paeoniae]|uniref:Helix-turn-helix domain-containing protein n=1 Tax=Paenibacillus paeoniae TaxID=2292705 RepID=A0A371P5M8_9BACL|nr:helix-turn-helix transcriptional regulator [Paenibacillus paeoniae]REK71253.1 helix-turn-helix domain-containing protein [Paenibacillus paeoniae]